MHIGRRQQVIAEQDIIYFQVIAFKCLPMWIYMSNLYLIYNKMFKFALISYNLYSIIPNHLPVI